MNLDPFLDEIKGKVATRFDNADRVRSFSQFFGDFLACPRRYLRCAPQYILDMVNAFGTREATRIGRDAVRYKVFDRDFFSGEPELAGQERVQEELYSHLVAAAKQGKTEKMLLLHGPNGSGKTTVVECLVRGLEHYSRSEEGALFNFNWIFTEADNPDRIGFEGLGDDTAEDDAAPESYAHLKEKHVSAKINCELRDSPLFLIPRHLRREIIDKAIESCPEEARPRFAYDYFIDGDLCQKCKRIFDALLLLSQGDWRKVVRHVQVERFFISKRYRTGAVSIEPQGNVDAAARPIQHENSWNIPAVLRNISLYEPVGDIVDANHGLLEYSDFLKRPMETNKYLLTTCEHGTVNLTNCIAYLDIFIIGTSNEKQLNIFKKSPDFSSFKGRMELVAVPYLLKYSMEALLYTRQIRLYSRDRHVTPHTAKVAALWAILTRLRRPNPERFDPALRKVVANLSPLEKALLYDSGETPIRLPDDERKALRAGIIKIRREFEDVEGEFEGIPGFEFEGRRGASPREMLTMLARAAESRFYSCLTPMAVFKALEELLKDSSLYDYLRIPVDNGYHDVHRFLEDVQDVYLRWVTEEVYDSIELIDEGEYDRVFLEYFRHVKSFHTKEKVFNPVTDSYEPTNEELMNSIESLLNIKEEKKEFRSRIITRIAAWSLDHPEEKLDYQDLFPEISAAMRKNFYSERNRLLTLVEEDILKYGTDEFDLLSPQDKEQVEHALTNMKAKYNYCDGCARDVIAFVLKLRKDREKTSDTAGQRTGHGKTKKEKAGSGT